MTLGDSITYLAATLALLVPMGSTASEPQLELDAELHVNAGRAEIVFRVSNLSQGTIEMYEADLPWGSLRSLLVLAVDPVTNGVLPREAVIDDPGPLATVLKPGESRTGTVRLYRHIKEIDEARKTHQLVVFWFHDAKNMNGASLGRFGGWVPLIPAN
jgi:hypothetical protein